MAEAFRTDDPVQGDFVQRADDFGEDCSCGENRGAVEELLLFRFPGHMISQ